MFWYRSNNCFVLGIRKTKGSKKEEDHNLLQPGREICGLQYVDRERETNIRSSGADVFMELLGARQHDDRHFSVAEDGELVGLLEQPIAPLRVGHLPVGRVLDPLDLDLPPRHFFTLSLSL